jgi:hypothetical protein
MNMASLTQSFFCMRVFPVLLLCLALATCSSNVLRPQINTSASAELKQYASVQLVALPPPQQDSAAPPAISARLTPMLREGLSLRGYRADPQAAIRAYYWLEVRVTPIDIEVNMAPPAPLGPYQSVQRLQDENATLHLRLANEHGRVLWEGQIDTGLSPTWERDQQLQKACDALLQQLPSSNPSPS